MQLIFLAFSGVIWPESTKNIPAKAGGICTILMQPIVILRQAAVYIKDLSKKRNIMEIKKSDWKLFRERLPGWQEAYMERLVDEYIEYLNSDERASTKFWEMEKKIKQDRSKPGVLLSLEKKNVDFDLMHLLKDEAINFDDLEGFSPELIERVRELSNVKW